MYLADALSKAMSTIEAIKTNKRASAILVLISQRNVQHFVQAIEFIIGLKSDLVNRMVSGVNRYIPTEEIS